MVYGRCATCHILLPKHVTCTQSHRASTQDHHNLLDKPDLRHRHTICAQTITTV
jgi:hypothetical protein